MTRLSASAVSPSSSAAQSRWAPYLFVLPFVIVFICFMLYPLGRSLVLSFEKTSGTPLRLTAWDGKITGIC